MSKYSFDPQWKRSENPGYLTAIQLNSPWADHLNLIGKVIAGHLSTPNGVYFRLSVMVKLLGILTDFLSE